MNDEPLRPDAVMSAIEQEEQLSILNDKSLLRQYCLRKMYGEKDDRGKYVERPSYDDAKGAICDYLLHMNHIRTIRNDRTCEIWIYRDGIYCPEGATYINEFCVEILGHKYKRNIASEIIAAIRAQTFVEQSRFFESSPFEKVCLTNGIYDLTNGVISPHTPTQVFFSKHEIVHDATATCTTFTTFLEQVLEPNDIPLMQEWIGYLFFGRMIHHKFLIMCGTGRNGKSTLIDTCINLVGRNNATTIEPHDIVKDPRLKGELWNKKLWCCADVGSSDIEKTNGLKQLTGEDTITVDRKHTNTITFSSHAKIMFGCNQLPKFKDNSDALIDRLFLLNFRQRFIDATQWDALTPEQQQFTHKADTSLRQKLMSAQEISGIFNWAVEGMKRLLWAGHFSYTKTAQEVRNDMSVKTDSLRSFCDECITFCPAYTAKSSNGMECVVEKYIPKEDFRQKYYEFCKHHNTPPVNDSSVGYFLLHRKGFFDGNVKETRHRIDGQRRYSYTNLKWEDDESDENRSVTLRCFDRVGQQIVKMLPSPPKQASVYGSNTNPPCPTPGQSKVGADNIFHFRPVSIPIHYRTVGQIGSIGQNGKISTGDSGIIPESGESVPNKERNHSDQFSSCPTPALGGGDSVGVGHSAQEKNNLIIENKSVGHRDLGLSWSRILQLLGSSGPLSVAQITTSLGLPSEDEWAVEVALTNLCEKGDVMEVAHDRWLMVK